MAVAGRATRLRDRFEEARVDALLVTNLRNVRYLTGFTGSAALLLVAPDALVLVTDGRYREQAFDQVVAAGVDARIEIGLTGEAQREILSAAVASVARLGLEAEAVTWGQQRRYEASWFAGCELVPTEGLVESLRAVKDEGEVARIEAAAGIADAALAELLGRLPDGLTEIELGLQLDTAMRRLGASAPSFETIVASGPNGARPHHRPSDRVVGESELVVFDFGATVDGYRSDMTRTVWFGDLGATESRMYDVVKQAQAAGVAAVRAGASGRDVDEACRAIIRDAGWGEAFVHGTGHGVGLDIHEDPRVSWAADGTLADGHVVTVEPGVYLPELGGVRIEDTVVVTTDGCRTLTRAPKA
jgi:Xaa-Pro aminopeptidase